MVNITGTHSNQTWRAVQEQSRYFWNSPWAMVSQWRPDQTRDVFVYEHDQSLILDIDLAGISPDDVVLIVGSTRINLEVRADAGARYGGDEILIPLPFHVDPQTAHAQWHHGLLEIKVRRQVTRVKQVTLSQRL